jgi:hypothetical protein
MTVLPTVRGQLLAAAEHQATTAPVRRRPHRPSRPHVGALPASVSVAVALGVAVLAVVLLHRPGPAHRTDGGSPSAHGHTTAGTSPPPTTLLVGPMHLPSLRPGERCPATPGRKVHNPYFTGIALGTGPVRVLVSDRGDLRHGRIRVGTTRSHSMSAIQTMWFVTPALPVPFEIRGGRLGAPGRIAVKPGVTSQTPGSGPLLVGTGPTINSFPNGDRIVPGSTWVGSPGCYAWEVDANHFREVIVFQALPATHR